MVEEAHRYGQARRKAITEALERPVTMKDSPDVVISGCPDLSLRVGGVSVLENRPQIIIIAIGPRKGLGPQIFDAHRHAARKAHTITVARTAVNLEVVLWNV
jgi:hypothetical protein